MNKKLWVHIRSSELHQALYIDGKREFEDDSIDVVEAFDVLKEKMNGEPCIVDFTNEDLEFSCDEPDLNYDKLFPETIKRRTT